MGKNIGRDCAPIHKTPRGAELVMRIITSLARLYSSGGVVVVVLSKYMMQSEAEPSHPICLAPWFHLATYRQNVFAFTFCEHPLETSHTTKTMPSSCKAFIPVSHWHLRTPSASLNNHFMYSFDNCRNQHEPQGPRSEPDSKLLNLRRPVPTGRDVTRTKSSRSDAW